MGIFDPIRKILSRSQPSDLDQYNDPDWIYKHMGVNKSYTETTSRPAIMQPYMATDTGAKLPIYPFPLIMIYELADNVDALRIPIESINREAFKNGFEVIERYKYKCNDCGKEFKYKPEGNMENEPSSSGMSPISRKPVDPNLDSKEDKKKADIEDSKNNNDSEETKPKERPGKEPISIEGGEGAICDSCGSSDLKRPEPKNRQVLESLYRNPVNNNEQTIMDVARQLERDLEVADNAYLLLLKNYKINDATGDIDWEGTKVKEALRIDPPQVAMICDSDGRIGYDDKRIPVYVCPRFEHRDKRLTVNKCARCGAKALRAVMEVSSIYSIGIPQPKRVIYGSGEVIWKAGKYKPGLIYGYSPIYSVWSKVMALSHMDEYIRKYFDKMRPPRGLLVIASRNYETFRKAWGQLEKKATEDPYMIHPLMVESETGGRQMAQWLDFTGSLKELQFVEVRKELRQIIGAVYGVLPLYFGEMVSGWSNEGLQVTITNRAIKFAQDYMRDNFFDRLAKELGVEDWTLQLKMSEEADRMRELQTEAQEVQIYSQLQQMGFAVERTHRGEWKVSKSPTFEQLPDVGMGRGDSLTGSKETTPQRGGAPFNQRPSDEGGTAQGHPSPGGKKNSFNISNKEAPHTREFWINKLTKDGTEIDMAVEIVDSWETTKRKSGTLYFPTTADVEPEDPPVGRKPTNLKKIYIKREEYEMD